MAPYSTNSHFDFSECKGISFLLIYQIFIDKSENKNKKELLQRQAAFGNEKENCVFLLSFHSFALPLQKNRDVAQLVAHYVRDVDVASSNLVIPT